MHNQAHDPAPGDLDQLIEKQTANIQQLAAVLLVQEAYQGVARAFEDLESTPAGRQLLNKVISDTDQLRALLAECRETLRLAIAMRDARENP